MDQWRSELKALADSIQDRRRQIEFLEDRINSLGESVREFDQQVKRLHVAQAFETAHVCALVLAAATRPEPPSPLGSPVTGSAAFSVASPSNKDGSTIASPSGVSEGSTLDAAGSSPQHARPNARSRWRRFRRRGVSRDGRVAPGTRTTGVAPRCAELRVGAEGILHIRVPSRDTMSDAKVEAIWRGRARGMRNTVDLGFRHLSPRVRCFSVIRPASSVPFRADPGGNAPRGFAAAVRELAHRSIRKAGRPMNRNEIVALVSGSGMPLPKNNLKQKVSKILLEDSDLVNVRGAGYTIRTPQGL